jgi:hypothetical protein
MMRSGQKILSVFLLLPILTILAHNSIPHHHHFSPFEVCYADLPGNDNSSLTLNSSCHGQPGHHEACCFNPEFTIDWFKILITAVKSEHALIVCPLKWIESEYVVWYNDDALCRTDRRPNLLRGPPAAA